MKKLFLGLALLLSFNSFASYEGVYKGRTYDGNECTLEILSYKEIGNDIKVELKYSLAVDPNMVTTGRGEIKGYSAGQINVGFNHEDEDVSERMRLYFNIWDGEVTGINTADYNLFIDRAFFDKEFEDVCTYLEKQ